MKQWITHVRTVEQSMGNEHKEETRSEKLNLSMKKYLVIIGGCRKGSTIKDEMLTEKRTGGGILPTESNLEKIIGKSLTVNIDEDSILSWDMLE